MKRNVPDCSQRYKQALRAHLKKGPQASAETAAAVARLGIAAGPRPLALAKLHEQTLITEILPGCPANQRAALRRQAASFFAAAIAPIDKTAHGAKQALRLQHVIATLSQHTVELAASNLESSVEITRRKAMEESFRSRERDHLKSLKHADMLKEQLRRLSRLLLSAQEDERKRISRELHDVIAQALTGITIRLANLKREAQLNTEGLDQRIADTQQLVTRSVEIVHKFAIELRPAALDDLGLIPAIHSFMNRFMARTGVRTRLTACPEVDKLDALRRTVLYRVAQEALTNVGRHAHAGRVDVDIRRNCNGILMQITDDGRSFRVDPVLLAVGGKRLGVLGMRERVEMVGGRFDIESAPGKGTTVTAEIPFAGGGARTPGRSC